MRGKKTYISNPRPSTIYFSHYFSLQLGLKWAVSLPWFWSSGIWGTKATENLRKRQHSGGFRLGYLTVYIA